MRGCFLFFLVLWLAPLMGRADLRWASTVVYTAAEPTDGVATAEAVFTNTGNYPIKITATHTSCGCTAAVTDGRAVGSGETGKLEITFKTLGRRGLYEEPILVETNDPAAKESAITLRVLIRNPVELLPTLLFWQAGEALTPKVIRVTVGDGFKLKNIDATCADPGVDVRLDAVRPGAEYKLTVTPKTEHVKATVTVTPEIEGRATKALTAHVRVI